MRPQAEEEDIEKLGCWEALLKRGAEKSALLALFDDPQKARRWVRRTTGLRLRPRPRPDGLADRRRRAGASPSIARPQKRRARPGRPPRPSAISAEERRAYKERRERDLAAPMAAMAAFCAERSIDLYFVTPYGPYFDLTDDELARMSVHHFLEDGGPRPRRRARAPSRAEVELITRVARRVAERRPRPGDRHAGGVSRGSSLRTSPDFTEDGVHLSPAGNAALGRLIAERIAGTSRRGPSSGD